MLCYTSFTLYWQFIPALKICKRDIKQLKIVTNCTDHFLCLRAMPYPGSFWGNRSNVRLFLYYSLVFCFCSSWKVKNVHLLFTELLWHKSMLHDFCVIVPPPPESPDAWHGDRSQLSRSDPGQLTFVSYTIYVSSVPGSL